MIVVVTRHPALVKYLKMLGLIKDGTPVVTHATIEDVRGKHVIGVLPLHLAVHADCVTEITIVVPEHARGRELTLSEVMLWSNKAATYKVTAVDIMWEDE